MIQVFADTLFWVASLFRADPWHTPALQARAKLGQVRLVTTDEVLGETLTAVCAGGAFIRSEAVALVGAVLSDNSVTVIPQTHTSFLAGVDLYERRPDKSYSLTDCISMNVMRTEGITDALTNDRHFAQEGFNVLIQR